MWTVENKVLPVTLPKCVRISTETRVFGNPILAAPAGFGIAHAMHGVQPDSQGEDEVEDD